MSNPYNQYPPNYSQQGGGQGYPPQQQYQQQYPPQPQYGAPQAQQQYGQQYPSQPQYGQHYQQTPQAYGPPGHGGFQHGQQAGYYDPNSQQYGGYGPPPQQYGQYPSSTPGNQFPQQGAYNQAPFPNDPNNAYGAPQPGQPGYGSTDPAQQQEGDRGLLGAMAGGLAGRYAGKQQGHGLLGTLGGAFVGSKLEDKFKHSGSHGKRW